VDFEQRAQRGGGLKQRGQKGVQVQARQKSDRRAKWITGGATFFNCECYAKIQ
jgi:hypothetical protein